MKTNVVSASFKPRRWWQRWQVYVGAIVVVLAIAGVMVVRHVQHDRDIKRANLAQQKNLQTQLAQAAFSQSGNQLTIQLANQLLAGVQSKKYTLSSLDVAQVYINRATAYANEDKLQAALADYQTAASKDAGVKIGALQGELSVQSRLGNKAALVPILQQLVPLLQHSEMPLANQTAAEYQADITALQNGQEVSF